MYLSSNCISSRAFLLMDVLLFFAAVARKVKIHLYSSKSLHNRGERWMCVLRTCHCLSNTVISDETVTHKERRASSKIQKIKTKKNMKKNFGNCNSIMLIKLVVNKYM